MTPLVSIIVNCFNQGCYLERSVKSVLSQTFSDIECLIVDDGSTDNTRQIAEHLMKTDPRVKYYHKENGGLPSARNFGIQKANGEWIKCLDADDWIHEEKIAYQLSCFSGDKNENIVLYTDYERVILDKDENIVDRQPNIVGSLTTEQLIQRLLIPDFLANSPHPALQQAMLMHKSIFNKHRFDENLKALGDRYFALDILANGVKFVYTPITGAFYTKHQTNRTNKWSYMKDYYILFYETVYKNHKDFAKLCRVGTNYLLDDSIREKETNNFERLVSIAQPPFEIFNNQLKFNHRYQLKLFYSLRLGIPNFILYKKYRGPRSRKVIAIFSQLLHKKQ
ncbi:capsule biosynthesis protein CapI [Scytonema hofmannii PCC 7110]|uniref:Capsule biosynthesis protein CapI n=1 Tax=Scytonema hofmannii PCC 7110 TaxID=128403 RepID=A0A139XBA8_9CYAN|nr:glycosyltransferase family 2 protein [Scytonema hofmannii]KYC41984.1 capsule biosynthesis protein CapI [Scytonema hofmannii PCC 7110]